MIELSNSNAQTLAAGQSLTFNMTLLHTGCAECHRDNTGAISLTQKNAIYEVAFNCNIGGVAEGEVQIGLSLNGSPLQETIANVVTTTAGDLTNVSASTFIKTCGCGVPNATILLTNTGTEDINIGAYPRLSVKRIA